MKTSHLHSLMIALALVPAMATSIEPLTDVESPQEIEKARIKIEALNFNEVTLKSYSKSKKESILNAYSHLDPNRFVPTDLLESTILYFDANKSKFSNQKYLAVVDFRPRSDSFRFFVVNLGTGEVDRHYTTHGTGSDKNQDGVAETFSNIVNSGTSSLGFIRTGEIYFGKFNRALRLDGLSKSNSRIRERAITLHGWDNAHEAPVIQGLTYGCLTFDWTVKDVIVDKLRDGALINIGISKTN